MTTFPGSPRLVKGGIVVVDAESAAVLRVIPLQYNPDTMSRSFQVKGAGGDGGDRTEALRLTGPPVETVKIEAELDAADQLEFPERNRAAVQLGVHPQLAAIETLIYPSSQQLQSSASLAAAGTIEIAPLEAPLTLFVWSKNRSLPVRLTELSVTEEAFDPSLNPIRAKVSLGMRVLSVNDLEFGHKGSSVFMAYLQQKERLAARSPGGTLKSLDVTKIF